MIKINDEYRTIAKEYKKTFGYGVPLSMIPPTIEMSDLITQLKHCIETKEDNLLEHFNVHLEDGHLM